jgi:hypothetical protein
VANSNGVVRFPYKNGDLVATAKPEQIVDMFRGFIIGRST